MQKNYIKNYIKDKYYNWFRLQEIQVLWYDL